AEKSYSDNPIKINIPHPSLSFNLDEEQLLEYRVKSGDTILKILFDLGVEDQDVFAIVNELKKVYDSRSMYAGQRIFIKYKVNIDYQKDGGAENIDRKVVVESLSIAFSPEKEVVVSRKGDASYEAKKVTKELIKYTVKYSGEIKTGLFVDGVDIGIPPNVVISMINLYSFDVDFQRDIRGGDKFEVLFESFYDKDGKRVKDGDLLFTSLTLQRKSLDFYLHKIDGEKEYFDAKGNSVRKSLLRTPINGARVSSGFGMRRHPVLGYSRMHKGLDFAASRGTPILSAGSGVITYYGRKGSYGNYVQIRHNSNYSTAYAHASRFVRGLKKGSRVEQGQVVAYVGTTGRSTGPHLHYEVLYNGKQINPIKVKSTPGKQLKGKDLARFNIDKNQIEDYLNNTPNQNNKL
ncbi:MAG: M23 family metallopeptidase, partial [Proteobacteria bacterium]|nr:M23 family metallopeptidase [Pseudomonadota bacterium]